MPALPFELQLFGTFTLHVEGVLAVNVPKPAQELLARLAVTGDRGVDRVEIATSLWPDVDAERALFYLRRSLTQLRAAFGVERQRLKTSDDRRISLDLDGCACDVALFESASKTSDPHALAAAVGVYQGKFLAGHRSDWVRHERARYASRQSAMLCALGTAAEERGEIETARDWLNRAVQSDPLREETCRQLMRVLAGAGDFVATARAFRDLRLSLRREVGLAPGQATVALYRELLAGAKLVASARSEADRPPLNLGTLPTPPTPFFGRYVELNALREALQEHRLVTLTGHGGVGKTRLALEVAQDVAAKSDFRVAFADASVCSSAEEVAECISRALGVSDSGEPVGRVLLILDGAEHVASRSAVVLGGLLQAAPELHVFCTSRLALQMREEHVILLNPMRLPSAQVGSSEDPASAEAVAFFLDCAKRAAPSSLGDDRSLPEIVEVCRRLDGLPLALELAAVRLRTLPLSYIVANLDDQFGLLDGERDGQDRRTIRNVLEWSFNLLTPEEAALFVRLGVFPSGFNVAAAEGICGSAGLREERVPLLLSNLVDHSLVVFDSSARSYRMLETVRNYARIELEKTPDVLDEARARHAAYYLSIAGELNAEDSKSKSDEANFIAATDYFLAGADLDRRSLALRLVNRRFPVWYRLGAVSDGVRTALKVTEAFRETPTEALAEVLFRAAGAAHWLYKIDLAKDLFSRAEALADMHDLESWGTESIRIRGELAANEGRLQEAQELLTLALDRFRAAGDPRNEAACLGTLGYVARQDSRVAEAFDLTEAALALYTACDDLDGRLWCLGSLAAAHLAAGSPGNAVPILMETLELQERAENWSATAWNLTSLGVAHMQLREFDLAESFLDRALAVQGDVDDMRQCWPMLELGELYRQTGRLKEAEAMLTRALKLCRESGAASLEVRALLRLSLAAVDRGDFGSGRAYRSAALEMLATIEHPPHMDELEDVNSRLLADKSSV